jgi:hypothetical protein
MLVPEWLVRPFYPEFAARVRCDLTWFSPPTRSIVRLWECLRNDPGGQHGLVGPSLRDPEAEFSNPRRAGAPGPHQG